MLVNDNRVKEVHLSNDNRSSMPVSSVNAHDYKAHLSRNIPFDFLRTREHHKGVNITNVRASKTCDEIESTYVSELLSEKLFSFQKNMDVHSHSMPHCTRSGYYALELLPCHCVEHICVQCVPLPSISCTKIGHYASECLVQFPC